MGKTQKIIKKINKKFEFFLNSDTKIRWFQINLNRCIIVKETRII